jgi:hypothetical protein
MSCVFQNIDPLTSPPLRPASVYPPPPAFVEGGGHTRKETQDTALYSTYIESSLIVTSHTYICHHLRVASCDTRKGDGEKKLGYSNSRLC